MSYFLVIQTIISRMQSSFHSPHLRGQPYLIGLSLGVIMLTVDSPILLWMYAAYISKQFVSVKNCCDEARAARSASTIQDSLSQALGFAHALPTCNRAVACGSGTWLLRRTSDILDRLPPRIAPNSLLFALQCLFSQENGVKIVSKSPRQQTRCVIYSIVQAERAIEDVLRKHAAARTT